MRADDPNRTPTTGFCCVAQRSVGSPDDTRARLGQTVTAPPGSHAAVALRLRSILLGRGLGACSIDCGWCGDGNFCEGLIRILPLRNAPIRVGVGPRRTYVWHHDTLLNPFPC